MKNSEVTDVIGVLVGHTSIFHLDGNGYVVSNGTNKIEKVNSGDGHKDLIAFQEVIKDPNATVLNPFAEGIGKTSDQDWLFKSWRTALAYKNAKILMEIAKLLSAGETETSALPTKLIKMISSYVKYVDAKTADEIDEIYTADPIEYMSVYYKPKLKTAYFRTGIFQGPGFRQAFPKIRKKTWTYIECVLFDIFQLDKTLPHDQILSHLLYKTSVLGYPRLDAKANLMLKLYELTNQYYGALEEAVPDVFEKYSLTVDVSEFGKAIASFPECFEKTKHFIQPTMQRNATDQPVASPISRNIVPDIGMPLPVQAGRLYNGVPLTQNGTYEGMPLPQNHMSQFVDPSMPMPRQGAIMGVVPPMASMMYREPMYGTYGNVPPGASFQSSYGGPVVSGYGTKILSRPIMSFGR